MNIIQIISNKEWGGGESYAVHLAQALSSEGHSVVVICRKIPAIVEKIRNAGFEPLTLGLGGALDIFSPVHISRVVRRFAGNDPVNIHVHNFKDAALAAKVKRLSHDREVNIVCTRHLVRPAKTHHQRLLDTIDHLIFVSQRAKQEFYSALPTLTQSEKITVIHNAIPDISSTADQPCDDKIHIAYLGRLCAEKGLQTLIEAAENLSGNWCIDIYGSGKGSFVLPLMQRCRRNGLNERIVWHGLVENVAEALSGKQIGVVPTLAPEAFGLTILEMMRQGIAVITTNNGAQPEIITDGKDGILVNPNDATALSQKIQLLIDDKAKRENIGREGRNTFEKRFTYPQFYAKIKQLYR